MYPHCVDKNNIVAYLTAMTRTTAAARSSTINIRVAPETLGLIDRAAKVSGKTRTDFILDTVKRAAEDCVLDQQLFVLSPAQWRAFNAALDAPVKPNERLAALLSRKPAWER
jgi:uncharacterized protein (DUF1778 family)